MQWFGAGLQNAAGGCPRPGGRASEAASLAATQASSRAPLHASIARSLHRQHPQAAPPPAAAPPRTPSPQAPPAAAMEPADMEEDVKLPPPGGAAPVLFGEIKKVDGAAALAAGVAAGNIIRQDVDAEVLDLPEVSGGGGDGGGSGCAAGTAATPAGQCVAAAAAACMHASPRPPRRHAHPARRPARSTCGGSRS